MVIETMVTTVGTTMDKMLNDIRGNSKYIMKLSFGYIDRGVFEKIAKRFIYREENGGLEWKYSMRERLSVFINLGGEYRMDIHGKNDIKKFWQRGLGLGDVKYRYVRDAVKSEIGDATYDVDMVVYEEIEKDMDKSFRDNLGKTLVRKRYIYENIYDIVEPEYGYRVYLVEEREIESEKTFKGSGVLGVVPKYRVEMVFDGNIRWDSDSDSDKGKGIDKFGEHLGSMLGWMLLEIQETGRLMRVSDMNMVIESFRNLTDVKSDQLRNEHFVLAEPVEILRSNFHDKGDNINVKQSYAVSYLPHGELSFLYIPDSHKKSVDERLYVVKRDFKVIDVGKKAVGYGDTLIEGYYTSLGDEFYMTDILFYKGEDVRLKKFYVKGKSKGEGKGEGDIRVEREVSRYDYMVRFHRDCKRASNGNGKDGVGEGEISGSGVIVKMVEYSFEYNVRDLLETRSRVKDMPVSGLMFRSFNEHYPLKGGYWYHLLQWRYPEYRTIDFLVKNIDDKVIPLQLRSGGKGLQGKILYYKSLNLKVGAYKRVYDPMKKEYKKIFTVADFAPRNAPEEVSYANIPMNNERKIVTTSNEEIMRDSIVRFLFEPMYREHTNEFLWTPVSVDHEKTRLFRLGDIVYGTSETYANHMWNAFSNPVDRSMLVNDSVPDEEVISTQTLYYEPNDKRYKKYAYQVFHNQVVKQDLIKKYAPARGKLLDLASGLGADMSKWRAAKLGTVIGIELVKESIEYGLEYYKRTPRPKPFVQYIWGNAAELIFPDYAAGLDMNAKKLMKQTFVSKYMFDVVSCQFALHYFFKDEITLRGLLQNVSDNLTIGGHFIGTTFDGKRIYEALKGLKHPYEGFVGDTLIWRITKDYKLKNFDEDKGNFGHKIDVYIPTIGITHSEYLVSFGYLKKIAKEYGLEVVSVEGFEEVYGRMVSGSEYYDVVHSMSDAEKVFSFMNNVFVFEKKTNASDKVYKKITDMIRKQKEKGRGKTMKGGDRDDVSDGDGDGDGDGNGDGMIRLVIRKNKNNK